MQRCACEEVAKWAEFSLGLGRRPWDFGESLGEGGEGIEVQRGAAQGQGAF